MFNPKVSDFLEENKNVSIIGLYWAGYWRLALCVTGGYIVFWILLAMFVS